MTDSRGQFDAAAPCPCQSGLRFRDCHGWDGPEPATLPSQPGERVVRVFVSSTFRDMQPERDHLVKVVFPEIRKLCESRDVVFCEVDLRWGITEEEAAEGQVLPLCFAEIERCRPYFIGLLGERYGSLPSEIDPQLLATEPWLDDFRDRSVTELEILHGVLRHPVLAGESLFYFRDASYADKLPEQLRRDFASESDMALFGVGALKERIRGAHARGELRRAPREDYPNPEVLGELVLRDLTELIERRFPSNALPDPLDQLAAQHEAFARSRRVAFVGRENELAELTRHLADGTDPIFVSGAPGVGKSALLAELVARLRAENGGLLLIQHFAGGAAQSADWQALVRRVLGELKREFRLAEDLPNEAIALSHALAHWFAKTARSRGILIVIDALNQLTEGPRGLGLGWLPTVLPRNVRIVVSVAPGETLEKLRARGWRELKVPAFERSEIALAAERYLAGFAKKLEPQVRAALLASPQARNPLYLRAVLSELRQVGEHERLMSHAADYLAAPDLSALFDGIIRRWEVDFGSVSGQSDLVQKVLCLIASSRFGLSEVELLDLLGGDANPLPRRKWTPLHLAMDSFVAQRDGLLCFSHEHFRQAVRKRWLSSSGVEHTFHLWLASYFGRQPNPTDRKLDELPKLLALVEQWQALATLLTDRDTFLRMRSERWRWELIELWIPLTKHVDPVSAYAQAVERWEGDYDLCPKPVLWNWLAEFHMDAGRLDAAEPLIRYAAEELKKPLGRNHPHTLTTLHNLASLLRGRGDIAGSESLYLEVIAASRSPLGDEDTTTLASESNLALSLASTGEFATAEALCRQAYETLARLKGKDHPDTLASAMNVASVSLQKGDLDEAERLFRATLVARERTLGRDAPDTLASVHALSRVLMERGSYAEAEPLLRRALETEERALGVNHPSVLNSVNTLAVLLQQKGDLVQAEPLQRRAFEICAATLGPDHPDALSAASNLAALSLLRGDVTRATELLRDVLAAQERTAGSFHLKTATTLHNLAMALHAAGDHAEAERLSRQALAWREPTLGRAHPDTLATVEGLAAITYSRGNLAEAEQLRRWAVAHFEQSRGTDHPRTIENLNSLAVLLWEKREFTQAARFHRRAFEARERSLGSEHPDTLLSLNNLAMALRADGSLAEAEPLLRRATQTCERTFGPAHQNTLTSIHNLAALLEDKGELVEAESPFRQALTGLVRLSPGPDGGHPNLPAAVRCYVGCLRAMGTPERKIQERLGTLGIALDVGASQGPPE